MAILNSIINAIAGKSLVEFASKRLAAFVSTLVANSTVILATAGLHINVDPIVLSTFLVTSFFTVIKYINDETLRPSVKKEKVK